MKNMVMLKYGKKTVTITLRYRTGVINTTCIKIRRSDYENYPFLVWSLAREVYETKTKHEAFLLLLNFLIYGQTLKIDMKWERYKS